MLAAWGLCRVGVAGQTKLLDTLRNRNWGSVPLFPNNEPRDIALSRRGEGNEGRKHKVSEWTEAVSRRPLAVGPFGRADEAP